MISLNISVHEHVVNHEQPLPVITNRAVMPQVVRADKDITAAN
jgi:hypothetical protein